MARKLVPNEWYRIQVSRRVLCGRHRCPKLARWGQMTIFAIPGTNRTSAGFGHYCGEHKRQLERVH